MKFTLLHLYPEAMSLYGEYANLTLLARLLTVSCFATGGVGTRGSAAPGTGERQADVGTRLVLCRCPVIADGVVRAGKQTRAGDECSIKRFVVVHFSYHVKSCYSSVV